MPRTPRLDYDGARHHVLNRFIHKKATFVTDQVCAMFLDRVAETPSLYGCRIHGYALMPNHYHLMVETPRGNLSEVMRHIGGTFTQDYNRAMQLDGPLFPGRYRNRVVESDAYWQHLLAYLHLNPVKAGLSSTPVNCTWSSHDAYVGTGKTPEWLTTAELLAMFGGPEGVARYVADVQRKRQEAPASFDPEDFWRPANTSPSEGPRLIDERTAEQALNEVAAALQVERSALLERPRGRTPNPPSWVAIWWLLRSTSLSQREVGEIFSITRPRVSQLRKKLVELSHRDPHVRATMDALITEAGLLVL